MDPVRRLLVYIRLYFSDEAKEELEIIRQAKDPINIFKKMILDKSMTDTDELQVTLLMLTRLHYYQNTLTDGPIFL
jgi:phosphoenolpyruvate carboxylase